MDLKPEIVVQWLPFLSFFMTAVVRLANRNSWCVWEKSQRWKTSSNIPACVCVAKRAERCFHHAGRLQCHRDLEQTQTVKRRGCSFLKATQPNLCTKWGEAPPEGGLCNAGLCFYCRRVYRHSHPSWCRWGSPCSNRESIAFGHNTNANHDYVVLFVGLNTPPSPPRLSSYLCYIMVIGT